MMATIVRHMRVRATITDEDMKLHSLLHDPVGMDDCESLHGDGACSASSALSAADVHVIEVLADKDSRYKIPGQKKPEITVRAGERCC